MNWNEFEIAGHVGFNLKRWEKSEKKAFSLGSLTNFFINLYTSSKGRIYQRTGEGLARQRKESAITSGNTSDYVSMY